MLTDDTDTTRGPELISGDVVWIERWGGVLGILVSYDEKHETLTMQWPDGFFGNWNNPQSFSPVKRSEIMLLSPSQVLEKMAILLEKFMNGLTHRNIDAIRGIANSARLMGTN